MRSIISRDERPTNASAEREALEWLGGKLGRASRVFGAASGGCALAICTVVAAISGPDLIDQFGAKLTSLILLVIAAGIVLGGQVLFRLFVARRREAWVIHTADRFNVNPAPLREASDAW